MITDSPETSSTALSEKKKKNMFNGGACRTATATPDLLITEKETNKKVYGKQNISKMSSDAKHFRSTLQCIGLFFAYTADPGFSTAVNH